MMENQVKPVLLCVSFGTSYKENRSLTIDKVEEALAAAFPDWEVRRAFTSHTIMNIMKKRDGIMVDDVKEAMERMIADHVKQAVIQPTHFMHGEEYDEMTEMILPYKDKFEKLVIGEPLLNTLEDYQEAAKAMEENLPLDDNEALVLMGHGTRHFANAAYSQLEEVFYAMGHEKVFVGTVEGFPTIQEVMKKLKEAKVHKVTLRPFMLVAGDHANNDMAGNGEDSWRSLLVNEGYPVHCVLEGLGQNEKIRQMYVRHAKEAMTQLSE